MRFTACWAACGEEENRKQAARARGVFPTPWPYIYEKRSLSRAICFAYRSSSEKTQPQYFCM